MTHRNILLLAVALIPKFGASAATFIFQTYDPEELDSHVGYIHSDQFRRLYGPDYVAQVFRSRTPQGRFESVGVVAPYEPMFDTLQGFVDAGIQEVDTLGEYPLFGGDQVYYYVGAWSLRTGDSFELSTVRGQSEIVAVTLGGVPANQNLPSVEPSPVNSVPSFTIIIPEPRSVWLCLLGGAFLVLGRWRWSA